MLYLIATPIGNLGDFSFRAIEVLRGCKKILCEDTRHARTLLKHYHIDTPLDSYHKFCEIKKSETILKELESGEDLALISDAGTPAINDPGHLLVKECHARNLPVTAIPGPCALIDALVLSGFDTRRFQFIGFFPRKEGERRRLLLDIYHYEGTTVVYESPHRLLDVLALFKEVVPEKKICIARELTKKFEEIKRGNGAELLAHFEKKRVKGEIVLVIEQGSPDQRWEQLSPIEHVAWIRDTFKIGDKEAIKIVADMRGVPKKEIYVKTLGTKETTS